MAESKLSKLVRKPGAFHSSSSKLGRKQDAISQKTWGTWLLACLGSFAIFLLRIQAETIPIAAMSEYGCLILGSLGVHAVVSQRTTKPGGVREWSRFQSRLFLLVGVLVILAPWIRNFIVRNWFGGRGEATELVWLGMLQHAAVWQAAVAVTSRQEWTSFLLSCFMMLFGVATSDRNSMVWVVAPFGLLASWWLLSQYWKSVAKGFVAYKSVPLIRIRIGIIGALVGLTAIVGLVALSSGRILISLDGFMPTSGGKGGNDQAARQGVGDGDMMVAAKDQAFTFGPIESEVFLESQLPSLYDLATEKYGDPKKPNKEISRAVSLEQQAQHTHEKITESKQKSREFSTLRTPNQKTNKARPSDRKSKAVLHVIGSLPMHLRLETFDTFDGIEWTQSDVNLHNPISEFPMASLGDKPWAVTASYNPEIVWPVRERVTVKTIQYKSIRIPSPSLATHVHVDKIDQPDFYSLTPDGQLCMPNGPYIPQLTVLHLLYHIPSLHVLRDSTHPWTHITFDENRLASLRSGHLSFLEKYLRVPEGLQSIGELRQEMLKGIPESVQRNWTDWQRVEAVINALRNDCAVEPSTEIADEATETITTVLKQKRGTDYHIASAAVMMLRDWRIPSRLVTGFYSDSSRWDRVAGMAEVLAEDMHTWAEVYVHGAWIPVEPSGTYAIPREHRSWYQWCVEAYWRSRDSIASHPTTYAVSFMVLVVMVMMRKRIANAMISALALLGLLLPAKSRVKVVLRILRFREWLSGIRFPKGVTISKWLEDQFQYIPSLDKRDQSLFIETVQQLAYGQSKRSGVNGRLTQNFSRLFRSVVFHGITDMFRIESVFRKRKRSSRSSKMTLGSH